ncbi:MAG: hypothetical protein MUC79_13435 [Thiobacillaceae bacterium]|jgi:hypothetical protein|nr:hypothetical protein [Thiobacillaceae bacterium]
MENLVLFRDRQELQAADLNNLQDYADDAHAHLITDAVTPVSQYVGLTVTARSATEIDVAPGRLYIGSTGRVYAITATQTHNLFAYLPLQDQKWLTVSVLGQEEESTLEPRDFLIDLQTREVEPAVVAMRNDRVAVVHIAAGLESITPERPAPPTGYTIIAQVRINPAGIQEVVLATVFRLPNLHDVHQRLTTAEGWMLAMEPRLAGLASDISGLADELRKRAHVDLVARLGQDMAGVKDRLGLPDEYIFYGADHFLDEDETDVLHADHNAVTEEGVRMPIVASATGALALANPLDPAVTACADGFLLPAFTEVTRLRLEERVGELTINQYQYRTEDLVQKFMTRTRIRYGATRTVCTNSYWWNSGRYDPASGIFTREGETFEVTNDPDARVENGWGLTHWVRVRQFWLDVYEESYWDRVVSTHTVQGSVLAQTVLSAQTGWLTSVELYLTGAAEDGALNVLLTETLTGQPHLDAVVARAQIAANQLSAGWNKITWSRPVALTAGRRYALVLVTGGAHRVGTVAGTQYTQGTLMYAQDGAYFSAAGESDLMMRWNFARFASPRIAVALTPLQLAGGIHDVDLLWEGWTPPGCEIHVEYQLGGSWYRMGARDAVALGDAATLLPLRLVFIGTTDLMPGLTLTDSVYVVRRFGTAFTHVSTERTLEIASDNIRVRCLLEDFDAAEHTFVCQLLTGAGTVNPTSTLVTVVNAAVGSRWVEARFAPDPAVEAYRIKLSGTTTDAQLGFHVAERYDLGL